MNILLNFLGIILAILFVVLFSKHRKQINWKMIVKALLAQFCIAIICIKFSYGILIIEKISDGISFVLDSGKYGLNFVFGSLMDKDKNGFIFVIHVLCNLIFLGALVNILSYLGVLNLIINAIGFIVKKIIGTSRVESFICTANMFLGQTESPLLISKYIKNMTESELFMVLVAGMGSMSVSILGGYNALGIPMNYLILSCILIPFGSIIIAKILFPETEKITEISTVEFDRKQCGVNVIDAMCNGAMDGVKMVLGISASIVAICAIVGLLNGIIEPTTGFSVETIIGKLFYPITFFFGIDGAIAEEAPRILGSKLVFNEFIAFNMLSPLLEGTDLRSQAIMCVSIAGFANFGSVGCCLIALSTLCPDKKDVIARIVGKALLGAFTLNIFNALIVGIVMSI